MFLAIDRVSKFTFVAFYDKAGKMNAAAFLRDTIKRHLAINLETSVVSIRQRKIVMSASSSLAGVYKQAAIGSLPANEIFLGMGKDQAVPLCPKSQRLRH
jgi:hypothetical protein